MLLGVNEIKSRVLPLAVLFSLGFSILAILLIVIISGDGKYFINFFDFSYEYGGTNIYHNLLILLT
jgi:hypothetical protein